MTEADGAYAEWSSRELHDLRSSVNKEGLELRREISAFRPTYYWWSRSDESEECPLCENHLEPYAKQPKNLRCCPNCKTVAAIPVRIEETS